ncbi:MAG: hypothetical protein J6T73_07300, partial [Clostridia bacterium]|nr:hypothetical protein [Clostridia bacterium]
MKFTKRIIALVLVALLALSFTACHKKGETAVKVGDLKFSSGYYACVLFFTDSSARTKVKEQLEEAGESTDDIDYYSQKIDGKKYVDWVKEETISTIKKIAAAKIYCKENKLELGDDEAQMKSYAEYYWDSYGYSEILPDNGVSKETLIAYMTDLSYEDLYFNHIFGADGEKAITEKQLKKELSDNYALADMLDVSFTELEDAEKTSKTEQLKGYLEELKAGKRTFEEIYHDYNGETEEEETADDGTDKPLDSHATLIGNDKTNMQNDYFDEIYKMKNNEIKIIDKDNDEGKILVVKKAVLEDPYYLKTYDSTLRHAIADEDFDEMVEDYIKALDFKEYSSATGNFNVKKIYYPETTAAQ